MKRLLIFFSFFFALFGCVRNPVTGKREFHMISEKAEIRLGDESRAQIIKEYGLFMNPAVQAYINEVGQKIVAGCERKNISYEFVILDTPLVNAFAVPGTVFLTRGILELIDDEAELASVIGHEVGHITGFHAVKMIQKAFGYQFLSTFSTIAVALYGPPVDDPRAYAVLHQATSFVAAGFLHGYGREFELEADRSGLRYAVLAGYDPDAMISFFRRMHSLGDDSAAGIELFLRTHPPTNDRIKQVQKILNRAHEFDQSEKKKPISKESIKTFFAVQKSTPSELEDHFERYHEVVRALPKSYALPSGTIKDSVYQNKSLGIRLEVPKGWKLENAFGRSVVSFHSPDGKAQGELQLMKVELDPVLIAEEKTEFAGVSVGTAVLSSREWAETIEPQMRMLKRTGRDARYPIGPSYVGTYLGMDRIGRPAFYKILYVVLGKNKESLTGTLLSCAAPEDSYLDYLPDFEKTMKSLEQTTK